MSKPYPDHKCYSYFSRYKSTDAVLVDAGEHCVSALE